MNLRVAFIDSGVNMDHPVFKSIKMSGITILDDGSVQQGIFHDNIGHGTGVVYNFIHYFDAVDCFMIKIFDREHEVDEQKIVYALKYILDYYPCQIVNISCGISRCSDIENMRSICNSLYNRGTIIVAAFDNDGSLSYPACFSHVIGVDLSTSCFKKTDLQYVESDLINVRGFGYQQRLPSLRDSYQMQSGSSFISPYVSALIAKCYQKGITDFDSIKNQLKEHAYIKYPAVSYLKNKLDFSIKKAVAFPFNKEMHALFSFSSDLNFEIIDICDYKFSGRVGKKVSDEIKIYHNKKDFIIKNIEDLDWNSFDTFIIGHTSKIELATGKEIKKALIKQCIAHKKNIYFYDMDGIDEGLLEIMNSTISYYSPVIHEGYVRTDQFGKLYEISKPILGFFGTSPKQGKMTTLLLTKNYLQSQGYFVGSLGTEPNSLLLGLDEQYNMGFNSTVQLAGDNAIEYVNGLMHNIELKNPDIILVGSQSQTVCMNSGNLGFYPHTQYEFLLGTQPDSFIININVFDENEYILRTVRFLESACGGTVLCLIVFPVQYDNYQGHLIGKGTIYSQEILKKEVERITKITNKPVFLLNDDTGKKIGELCIQYFGESDGEK